MWVGGGPEFELLLKICFSAAGDDDADCHGLDWTRVMALSRKHRIDGLVVDWLIKREPGGVPKDVLAAFTTSRREQSLAYLLRAAETLALSQALERRGLPCLVLKGCAVAETLFAPDPARRNSIDIDILVAPEHFRAAETILVENNYVLHSPRAGVPESARSMGMHLSNAFAYFNADKQIAVELHHRLLANPYKMAIPFAELLARSDRLRLGGGEVRVLGASDNAVFLCCHGTTHAYARLKWLADISRLFASASAAALEEMRTRARALDCDRDVVWSAGLLQFMTGASPLALTPAEASGAARFVSHARRLMLSEEPPDSARFAVSDAPAFVREMLFLCRFAENGKSLGFHLLTRVCNLNDLPVLRLGAKWWWLYALVGPPSALTRILGRQIAKPEKS